MRVAVLVLATAACSPPPTHLTVAVSIELSSDDPAAAIVNLEAHAYEPTDVSGDTSHAVGGIDARIELDGRTVPLLEDEPGHHVGEPQQGFPDAIRLLGDDESRELEHGPYSTATVERNETYIRVAFQPPVVSGEWVYVIRRSQSGVSSEPIYPGATALDFPPEFARLVLVRTVTTEDDGEGLRMGGSVSMRRELPVPRWAGDP